MFVRLSLCALAFSLAALGFAPAVQAEEKADAKQLEAQLEKLLEAYNKDDLKTFYADWAKEAEFLTSPDVYSALYKLGGKDVVGSYVPKTLKFRKETSVLDGPVLVVFFDAEFSKEKYGEVAANLSWEDGKYKFTQVRLAKK